MIIVQLIKKDRLNLKNHPATTMKYTPAKLARIVPVIAGLMAISLFGCDSDSATDPNTIVDVATTGGFTTLVAAVEAADLKTTLEGDGPFTVFAPTNAAFGNLPAGTLDDLLLPANKGALTSILTYHVVAGRVTSDQVVNLTTATTVQGEAIAIEVVNGTVRINGANVTSVDIEADNGVIHVIDAVLLPPSTTSGQ
jgi:uncharacterized surface protein with fasciclin (FAS1) repeats